jgi:hypothetical protein
VHTPDLDDVFLALTDHSTHPPAAFRPTTASIMETGADR